MRQLGLAMHAHHSARDMFPAGMSFTNDAGTPIPDNLSLPLKFIFSNALISLLPYIEESAVDALYDHQQPWYAQNALVYASASPLFSCPSASHDNPISSSYLSDNVLPRYAKHFAVKPTWPLSVGLTDYVLSKGVSDGWCRLPTSDVTLEDVRALVAGGQPVPLVVEERGMFDMAPADSPRGYATSFAKIIDGSSHTFAMGEGACGDRWQICLNSGLPGQGCPPNSAYRDAGGNLIGVYQFWFSSPLQGDGGKGPVGSVFGCTLEPLNKNPVTHSTFRIDTNLQADCRPSVDWAGIGMPTGSHRVSNFRSDHPSGACFLMADGSVHFVNDSIEMGVYRRLSTIAGSEPADLP